MVRSLALAAVCSWAFRAVAQPRGEFAPGQIFISENYEFDIARVRVYDPATGESWIHVDESIGLVGTSGLAFTPDGLRLRVISYGTDEVFDVDPAGIATLAYGPADGIFAPAGQNGMTWDATGNYFLSSNAHVIFRSLAEGGPVTIFANTGPGGMAFAANGDLFVASTRVRRITPQGVMTNFDSNFAFNESVRTLAISSRGDLFVGTRLSGIGRIYRYDFGLLENRRLMPETFDAGNGAFTVALSADERMLYVADSYELSVVDLQTEAATILAQVPPMRGWGTGIAVYIPPPPGDLNCDKRVNFFDIDPFLLALLDPAAYDTQYSFCRLDLADMNADGNVTFLDIDPFVECLFAACP